MLLGKKRLFALLMLGLIAAFALSACGGGGKYGTENNPIRLGFVPSEQSEVILSGADEIAALIEAESGLVVEPFVTTDYAGLIEAMCNEEAEVGALATFSYVLAAQRDCADVGLVSVRFGAPFYTGQLVARADSGIEGWGDLAGKTFCRPDPLSTSGWIIPSIEMAAAGLDPDTDLGEVVDADGHPGVVTAVYQGECDAGATYVDARGAIEEEFPDVFDVVAAVSETAEIPNDTISFAPHLDEETRAALTAALLAIAEDEANKELLDSVYEWDTLTEKDDSFFDGFRQILDAGGIDIEDLQ
jgi:phosphonate transport system substrate-binding protein